ncbi:unnamed protein product [Ceratitis capitata]|uniref:(Mediterranean fruit fly) hypothetical protein n=1 Tax=Ceratitis capitata TaxID=7213 RepID=A0A811VFH5_CERCA|nr:unnamed protein product [Ceratitis capitata]
MSLTMQPYMVGLSAAHYFRSCWHGSRDRKISLDWLQMQDLQFSECANAIFFKLEAQQGVQQFILLAAKDVFGNPMDMVDVVDMDYLKLTKESTSSA